MENNDYELVALAQENNEDAINMLYQKYKPMIIKKSKMAFLQATHHGIEINDIMQEGFIGLDKAINNFSQDDTASFYTFANICIDRNINNFVKKNIKGKNKLLNEAVVIDDGLENLLRDNINIEESFLVNHQENEFIERIQEQLTDFERKVFNLRLKEYTFEEIADMVNKDIKSIYNTFQRIRQKIKKNIKIDD